MIGPEQLIWLFVIVSFLLGFCVGAMITYALKS